MLNIIHNKNSILGRLVKFISTLISLIIIFSSILYSVREYYYLNQVLDSEISVITKIMGFNYNEKSYNKDFIEPLLESLKIQKAINAAVITDVNKNIIASYPKTNNYDSINIKHNTIDINNKDSYTRLTPIINNGAVVGYFYINAHYSELDSFIIDALYVSSWVLLISILISMVFSYLYSRSLCNPLLNLSNNMHKIINRQDYAIRSKVNKAPDEIDDLNTMFNSMLSKVQERDNEIKTYNKSLQLDIKEKDIKLKESYKQLQFAAYHDELTHLPNIRLFKSILEYNLKQAKSNNEKFAVLFIDIDNFKQVNDNYGHDVGDDLLKKVSEVFTSTLRKSDFISKSDLYADVLPISRLGGDEFTIILNNIENEQEIELITSRLKNSILNIKKIKGHNVHVSSSIGISVYPKDGEDSSTLLKHADAAMYHAKSNGKNSFEYYNDQIGNKIKNKMTIESQLADAVIDDQFIIEYQPKYTLNSNELVGFEALVRWQHPTKGILGPDSFINISEDSDMICTIGDIVIEKICSDIYKWDRQRFDYKRIAINISIRQFEKKDFVDKLCMNITKQGVNFNMIELELTEGMLVSNFEEAINKLNKLKNLGFSISIDDFGTGYSSFKYLSTLPVDDVKIDRTFVSSIDTNKNNLLIVKSIIGLAHSLSLKVVAEGVETLEHVSILKELNCDFAQGYYYSKPLQADIATELLQGLVTKKA